VVFEVEGVPAAVRIHEFLHRLKNPFEFAEFPVRMLAFEVAYGVMINIDTA